MSNYKRSLVEQLLPAVWDATYAFGMANPSAPDPDMPKAKADPKTGGILYAHLADIRQAWKHADVPQVERQAVLLHYGFGWTDKEIGYNTGVSNRAAHFRYERGVGRLTAYLNGTLYSDDDPETDDDTD